MTEAAPGGPQLPDPPDPVTWPQVRDELVATARRIPRLLAAVPDPSVPALGHWNVAEVATHLSHACVGLPQLARRDLDAAIGLFPAAVRDGLGTPSGALFPGPEGFADLMRRAVAADPERDLDRLGRVVEAAVTAFADTDHDRDDGHRPWIMDGVLVRPVTFGGHVLSEMLVHGDDIARAAGAEFPIPPRAAALVLRAFLLPMVCLLGGAAPDAAGCFRVALRLVGSDEIVLARDRAGMGMERPSRRRVDMHLRADPATLLLMIWKRRRRAALVARGRLLAWGRRPAALAAFSKLAPQV